MRHDYLVFIGRFEPFHNGHLTVLRHALGIARAAFEDSVGYVNQRRQFARNIIEFQGIQFMLADMATDLAMCEAWLWHVAGMVDAGAEDFGVEASMLKMRASDIAARRLAGGAADREFYEAKIATAHFFATHLLPRTLALEQIVIHGGEVVAGTDAALI